MSTRVEIIPDDDAKADPEVPKDVLEKLGPSHIMLSKSGHMMYIRASHWERIKHKFQVIQ